MERMFWSCLIVILVLCVYPLSVCQGDDSSGKPENIVLTPADQLILDAIDKVNGRIDKVNERIDNLWITMLGGFMGVMAFIGALVFWDRRTFMKRAREEMQGRGQASLIGVIAKREYQ